MYSASTEVSFVVHVFIQRSVPSGHRFPDGFFEERWTLGEFSSVVLLTGQIVGLRYPLETCYQLPQFKLWTNSGCRSARFRGSFSLRHFTFLPNVNKNVQSQLLGRWLPRSRPSCEARASVQSSRWHATLWQHFRASQPGRQAGRQVREERWLSCTCHSQKQAGPPDRRSRRMGRLRGAMMLALFMWIFRLQRASIRCGLWFKVAITITG